MTAPATPVPPAAWHLRLALALTLLLAVAIAVATLVPNDGRSPPFPYLDKIQHFVAFGLLVLPLATVLRGRAAVAVVVALAVAYGGAIELIQPRFGRGAEWFDFWADLAGALAGAALGRWLHPRLTRRGAADPSARPAR